MAKAKKKKKTATKHVYFFGNGKAEGKPEQKELLGGKGAGLAQMTRIGLPVPGGFTITTECCDLFFRAGNKWPRGLEKQVNVFFRLDSPAIHEALRERDPRMPAEPDPEQVFVRLRQLRNRW